MYLSTGKMFIQNSFDYPVIEQPVLPQSFFRESLQYKWLQLFLQPLCHWPDKALLSVLDDISWQKISYSFLKQRLFLNHFIFISQGMVAQNSINL